ncbi:unnamed protein product, partial [Iphiclides podalirius]
MPAHGLFEASRKYIYSEITFVKPTKKARKHAESGWNINYQHHPDPSPPGSLGVDGVDWGGPSHESAPGTEALV